VANETNKPTPFLCLLLKMLHLQPELAIVLELVRNEEFKYVRVLGAFYLRLMANSEHVYRELEPLLMDYRKLAKQTRTGWELTTMDQVAEELLARPICCEIALPRLASRKSLVAAGRLEGVPRESSLRHQFDAMQLILKRQDDAEQGEEDEQHARRKRARGGAGE
jgi:pre-mRNA-splicing factor 38A